MCQDRQKTILSGADTLDKRLFYIREAARNHWNLDRLSAAIRRDDLHHRGAMPNNFTTTMPDTRLARKTLSMFRDEYLLDIVNLDDIEAAGHEHFIDLLFSNREPQRIV